MASETQMHHFDAAVIDPAGSPANVKLGVLGIEGCICVSPYPRLSRTLPQARRIGQPNNRKMKRRRSRKESYIDFVSMVGNLAVVFGHEEGMEPSDAALWSRSRAGDAEAFGLLFERHAKTIYNYCFRRVGDWAVAEDLLSIVFLEAWRRRGKELPADKVLPWLYGIATNVVRNRRRDERRHAAALARVPLSPVEPGFEEVSDGRIDDERQMQCGLALLAQLPRREQDVFVLCAWMGLSYEDAALALATPVGTVRSRLSRARQRLRELDDGCGHEEGRTTTVQEALER
jgi:RNA polymerase sigma-70 factor (ECF subfamily)